MDYLPFIQEFKEIITFENENYNNNITQINNETIENILFILKQIDEILLSQLSLTKKYDYYNINETYFKDIHAYYNSLIINIFNEYKNKINTLNNSYIFHNSIRKIIGKLQNNKREYFKNITNEFSNNYNFHFFNISYDIGENVKLSMEKEYNDIIFNYVYDYVELFQNYTDLYINEIITNIIKMEKIIVDKFDDIYNTFLSNYKNNISIFINSNYIDKNFSYCLDYSYDLLKEKKNIDKYNNLIILINKTYLYCQENNENNDISLNEKINYLKKNYDNCINNYKNDNETIILLNCYKNNFYDYSAFYFNSFTETYKNKLDEKFGLIIEIIKNNFIDDNFMIKFLEEQNYKLQSYENASLSDTSYFYEEIEDFIDYYSNIKRNEYKNYLFDLLIESFNISYHNLIYNFVLDELIDNILIKINAKLDLNFEYIYEKISDEYYYYLLLLNDSEKLGNSTKNAIVNLYNNIKKKLNESFNYKFIDEINYYLNSFYRDNKKTFINSFINYYLGDINKYANIGNFNFNIFNIKELTEEIILNREFNKTIEKISNNLIYHAIIEPIKENINDALNNKIINIYNICDEFKNNISEILENIDTEELQEDMFELNRLILNYMVLVDNQYNYFTFKITDEPFNILNKFIKENLESPLLLIKNKYNTIEEALLNKILKIVNEFPDFFSIIKSKLNLESINDEINLISKKIDNIFIEYKDILFDDINSYINKLVHYTYIKGLNTYNEPCNDSFCLIDFNIINETKVRRNEENYGNKKYNTFRKNKTHYKNSNNRKIRNLEKYDETKGPITEDDIIDNLDILKETLFNFNKTYLNKDYKYIKTNFNRFTNNINNSYLIKLKRSLNMVAIKFSTILTESSYKNLEDIIFNQYYDIEFYLNNISNIIELSKNEILDKLSNSSVLLVSIYNIINIKTIGFYSILIELIQKKLKNVNKEEYNKYRKLNFILDFINEIKETKNLIEEFIKSKEEEDISQVVTEFLKPDISENELIITLYEKEKKYNFSFEIPFIFPITPTLDFIISIEPYINFKIGLELTLEIKDDISLNIDAYGQVEVGIILEANLVFPSVEINNLGKFFNAPQLTVGIGIEGQLISIKVGLKLSFILSSIEFEIDLYTEIKAFSFTFYCLFKFEFEIPFLDLDIRFEFYLFKFEFNGISLEAHKKKTYSCLK